MQIITIHGIRRTVKWYEDFKNLDDWKNTNIEVINFEYGYFPLLLFINPASRAKVLREFQEFYSKNFSQSKPPSIICHSFGTYIFFQAIKKYQSIRFDKVILCGSILSQKTDWKPFFESKQLSTLYNDYGSQDGVVKFSALVIKGCGKSGQKGFAKIPEEYSKFIIQRLNYFEHSDYFLPLHMRTNWATIFLPSNKRFHFDKKILRNEIIDRIYKNISADNISFSTIIYRGRIDERGNYFAQYSKRGVNNTTHAINEYNITTTADSTHNEEDMWFQAFDLNQNKIDATNKNDIVQNKTFTISFPNSIKQGQDFGFQYRFRWKETITLKGDTDHFEIKNAENVLISLNFKYTLKSPKFFVVADKMIVEEIQPEHHTEIDGTTTYLTNYANTGDNDGIIFYFEGCNMPTKKNIRFAISKKTSSSDNTISISKCAPEQIQEVYKIEMDVEFRNAANELTLNQRLSMFNDGFLVAKENEKVIGYIESLIWNDLDFETFDEIKNFPTHFNVNGDTLYIIFLAVQSSKRRGGIGQKLMEALEKTAIKYQLKQIKLVAKDDLIAYYKKFGFEEVRELPHFLKNKAYKSMLMVKKLPI